MTLDLATRIQRLRFLFATDPLMPQSAREDLAVIIAELVNSQRELEQLRRDGSKEPRSLREMLENPAG
ncbi:MAG: hypothetical protein HOV80_22145 [Polyangiaceae bacterium]|nr:hypothetical protein [Polyangiaceae bacterium]